MMFAADEDDGDPPSTKASDVEEKNKCTRGSRQGRRDETGGAQMFDL